MISWHFLGPVFPFPPIYWLGPGALRLCLCPPPSGPFSRCVVCNSKIPYHEGHDKCLFCLGESHSPEACRHWQAFTKGALKARQQHLKLHLWDSALSASQPSPVELPASSATGPEGSPAPLPEAAPAAVAEPPLAKATKKAVKNSSAPKQPPPARQTKLKKPAKNKFSTLHLPLPALLYRHQFWRTPLEKRIRCRRQPFTDLRDQSLFYPLAPFHLRQVSLFMPQQVWG